MPHSSTQFLPLSMSSLAWIRQNEIVRILASLKLKILCSTELLMKLWEGFPSPFNSPNEILLRVLHPIINQQKMCPEVTTCFEKLKSIAEEGQFYERKDNGGCAAHSKQTLCSQISTELQHLRFPKPASTFTSNQLALYLHLWNLWMLLKSVFGFKQMSEMWVSGFVFQFAPRFHVFRHLYFHLAVWGHSNGNLRVNPNLLPSRWQGKKRKLWEVGEAAEI